MKTYVLYNPLAGHGDSKAQSAKLLESLEGEVLHLDITAVDDYRALLSPLGEQDRVILCGGDGTINRFVNAVEGIELKCDVLYYALGTGNDFLKDLGLEVGAAPFSIKKYLEDLPVVEINGQKHRFLNGIGFGIDGYCCEVGDKLKAAGKKNINYTGIAIKGLLFHYNPSTAIVTVDGVTHTYKKAWIAATMKGRYYGGGMMTAPEQDRLDGKGEVTLVLFYGKGRIKTLIAFPSIFEGKHVEKKGMVAVHTGKEITVRFAQPASLQIDGETVLSVTEYRVRAGKDAVVSV